MRHPTGLTPAKQREQALKFKLLKAAGWKGWHRSCFGWPLGWFDPLPMSRRWVDFGLAWKRYERRLAGKVK